MGHVVPLLRGRVTCIIFLISLNAYCRALERMIPHFLGLADHRMMGKLAVFHQQKSGKSCQCHRRGKNWKTDTHIGTEKHTLNDLTRRTNSHVLCRQRDCIWLLTIPIWVLWSCSSKRPCPRRLRVWPVQCGNDMPRFIFVGYLSEVMKTWSWWKSQKQNDAAQTCCANSGKQPSATFFGYSVWGLDSAIGCFDSFHVDCPRSGWLGEWNQRFGGGVHSKDSAGFLFHCRFFNFNGGVILEGIQTIYCDLLEFHGFVQ